MKTADRIVLFIGDFNRSHDYAPSVREIADGVGLKSTSTVKSHLDKLKERGVINFEESRPRTVRVVS